MPLFAALISAGSAIAGTVGNVISSGNTAGAIKNAAAAQQQANGQGIAAIQNNEGLTGQLYSPYLNSGAAALSQLDQLLGLGTPAAAPGVAQASQGAPDYAAYVRNNPDLLAQYQAQTGYARGRSMADYGQQMWSNFDNSGRTYTPFGAATGGYDPAKGVQSLDSYQQQAQQPGGTPQSGAAQQQAAIDQLKAGPLYQALYRNGEQSALAEAAATGGLRGGNAERSFYNLGNDTLAQVIQQQVANLGGLAANGQSAVGDLAKLNTSGAGGIADLIAQGGANQAGAIQGEANAQNGMTKNLLDGLGGLAGNQQLLSALGIGGGIKTSTSNILGPDYSFAAPKTQGFNLNTVIPAF
jgi:hypothetical protein